MRLSLIFIFMFLTSVSFTMDVESVIKKMNEHYLSKEEFEVTSTYELFKGHTSADVIESYTGYYQKTKIGTYQKIEETESIAASDFFLMISHPEKILLLEKPKTIGFNELNFKESLEKSRKTELKEDNENYVVYIYMDIDSGLGLSLIKITIDKKSFLLKILDIYYSDEMNFSEKIQEQDYQQAHLRITYTKFSDKTKDVDKRFDLENYFTKTENKLLPTGSCIGYELIDHRSKKKL